MYQREVVRRRRQQSLAPANVRLEVVSISWETGVVWCTCKIPACILKATFSSSDTKRFVVLRAVLPNSGRVLVGVQQWSTPEGVVTTRGVVLCVEKQGGRAVSHVKRIRLCCGYSRTSTSWSGHPALVCQTHFPLSCEGPVPIAELVANIGILFACGVARAAPECCCSAQTILGVG